MSNCTIPTSDSTVLAKSKPPCRKAACSKCRLRMVYASKPGNDPSVPPLPQHDIIHDFVKRLDSTISKHSED